MFLKSSLFLREDFLFKVNSIAGSFGDLCGSHESQNSKTG
jgi:hypothetical protein